jgi:hypothetical protein
MLTVSFQGSGYCWSLAVVAYPAYGKELMEKWIVSEDKGIRWIMKENLKKNRLMQCDGQWTRKMIQKLGRSALIMEDPVLRKL